MVNIQLEDTVAAALVVRARSRGGLSLEDYLVELSTSEPATTAARVSGEEAIRLIEAEAGPGNSSYQGTYSREDIYSDHD